MPVFSLLVDEVILVTTANPVYLHCWNWVSRVWWTKFGVHPLLTFFGTQEEFEDANRKGLLSVEHGDVQFEEWTKPFENPSRPWESPTVLFWAAAHAPSIWPDPVRLIAGIDRMPLRPALDELMWQFPRDAYVLSFCGAYTPESGVNWANGWQDMVRRRYPYYPSEWVCGARSTHQRLLEVESDLSAFLSRVDKMDLDPMFTSVPGRWGLDEAYLAHQINRHKDDPAIRRPFPFWKTVCSGRRLEYGHPFTREEVAAGRWGSLNGGWSAKPDDDWVARLVQTIPVWR